MPSPSLRPLSQVSTILWPGRTSCTPFGFLTHSLALVSIPGMGGHRISAVPIPYLSSASPSSLTGGCRHILTNTAAAVLPAVGANTSANSNFLLISRLYRFTFVSALSLPVLRLNLTLPLRFQGLGTGGWSALSRQGFPAIGYQLTKTASPTGRQGKPVY